ncbi:hypothetical protein FBU59_006152, partial [Linderina macrospora]
MLSMRSPILRYVLLAFSIVTLYGLFQHSYQAKSSLKPYERTVSYQPGDPKPVKACFVVLARNRDWFSLRQSMKHMEDRFNHRFNYPYVILNDEPFTDEFKNMTQSMTKAEVLFGQIPKEHWSYPDWIDQEKARRERKKMQDNKVMYGGSES